MESINMSRLMWIIKAHSFYLMSLKRVVQTFNYSKVNVKKGEKKFIFVPAVK